MIYLEQLKTSMAVVRMLLNDFKDAELDPPASLVHAYNDLFRLVTETEAQYQLIEDANSRPYRSEGEPIGLDSLFGDVHYSGTIPSEESSQKEATDANIASIKASLGFYEETAKEDVETDEEKVIRLYYCQK